MKTTKTSPLSKRASASAKPRLSKRAITILRKVQAVILAEPHLYDQSVPHCPDHSCKSPACIGGWAEFFRLGRRASGDNLHWVNERPCRTLLGGDESFLRLYSLRRWPTRYRRGFLFLSAGGQARRAVRRIDHFIKTGGTK